MVWCFLFFYTVKKTTFYQVKCGMVFFVFFTRSKNKVKIFFWKMYAKIYFCTKDILALPSFFTVLNILLRKMYAKRHFCTAFVFCCAKNTAAPKTAALNPFLHKKQKHNYVQHDEIKAFKS